MKILVVGGAGYIGSHMVLALQEAGCHPVVLDNLSTGHRDAVRNSELIVGDQSDQALLERIFTTYTFSAVMHFASYIDVAESVLLPAKYYQNNVTNTFLFLEMMLKHRVQNFIFSSSAAVYGDVQQTPLNESHPRLPINPYGHSKKMVEDRLYDLAQSTGLRYAVLRYFNATSCDSLGRLRERHDPESHLIPLILQVAKGMRPYAAIYGDDYETVDGTCVRDYVHVIDLCEAHWLALQALQDGCDPIICNVGRGEGVSVKQVLASARRVTQHSIPVQLASRRAGDPAILVADIAYAKQRLGWRPRYLEIDQMIRHMWY
ncbi:MAG: UDP-glucose 4-epimerase GalE [Gammaproteobacteria bacterium RIFCSPHIGHO2_12_FULL_42_10]|nr:MAG: UDP-glucose 4-epimerase GalE [Gammaproteobacteria bacterium RIFCSPHIGHO2_12_FULL_42_10]